ncbi:GNAT family N-acetyltransferase [Vibrio nigripulchritudo]|uniref:GNAT family N-acetyltransferase n=1 Tax=Vibrio nigripulchritudo TaxID=28173 RepID=UPI00248FF9F7|nr:GNAT family N-acetyltransferase [Vibrio nigripulchritudo]BDU40965.1 N-acetyltransferase [Vibrio nigripulchritudo]BDU46705.1 N-acetyltransferase [Vibrio nigripulchritudo]
MDISPVEPSDFQDIVNLVAEVTRVDILPHFDEQGKTTFTASVIPDVEKTMTNDQYLCLKLTMDGEIVGYGAMRDKNYITHIFVSKKKQSKGLGKQLLEALLSSTDKNEVCLRSSVNAAAFYEKFGFIATDSEQQVNGIRFVPMTCYR